MAQTPTTQPKVTPAAQTAQPKVTLAAQTSKKSALLETLARPQRERSIVDLLTPEAYDAIKKWAGANGYRDFAEFTLHAIAEKAERDGIDL